MIINEDVSNNTYQIQAYAYGSITINHKIYHHSLVVMPEKLIEPWPPQHINELTQKHLDILLELKPEIILLGTGEKFLIPQNFIINFFKDNQLAFEFMDTHNACRTFTALSAEGRNVLAALIIK